MNLLFLTMIKRYKLCKKVLGTHFQSQNISTLKNDNDNDSFTFLNTYVNMMVFGIIFKKN